MEKKHLKAEQTELIELSIEEKIRKELNEHDRGNVKKRSMHNLKKFKALVFQMEENSNKELDRLTTDNRLWNILSNIGLLPKRKIIGYGYFIKKNSISNHSLELEKYLKLKHYKKFLNKLCKIEGKDEDVVDSL